MDEKGRSAVGSGGNFTTALFHAAWKGRLEVVTVLVQAGAGVDVGDNSGTTPLHIAAACDHLSVCKYLIEDGKSASINKANKYGATPLKWATDPENQQENTTAVIAYLKSKGGTM